ncbi:retroviral-like aspartic protease [Phanerochaete sordida]|uniref:Retroviral-like aspartic protease n=1 Tax=Phanerochaete sordida TaxID=48140 RepID=A0A9P3GCQ1_9APHY|nr:retroviral-like aspartic protease [Phanerochaete sordida]
MSTSEIPQADENQSAELNHITEEADQSFRDEEPVIVDEPATSPVASQYDGSQYDPDDYVVEDFGYLSDHNASDSSHDHNNRSKNYEYHEEFRPYLLDDYFGTEEELNRLYFRAAANHAADIASVLGEQQPDDQERLHIRDLVRPSSPSSDSGSMPSLQAATPIYFDERPDNIYFAGLISMAEETFSFALPQDGLEVLDSGYHSENSGSDSMPSLTTISDASSMFVPEDIADWYFCDLLAMVNCLLDDDDYDFYDDDPYLEISIESDNWDEQAGRFLLIHAEEDEDQTSEEESQDESTSAAEVIVSSQTIGELYHTLDEQRFTAIVSDHLRELERQLNVIQLERDQTQARFLHTRDELITSRRQLNALTGDGQPTAFDGVINRMEGPSSRPYTRSVARFDRVRASLDRAEGENRRLQTHVDLALDQIDHLRRDLQLIHHAVAEWVPRNSVLQILGNASGRFDARDRHTHRVMETWNERPRGSPAVLPPDPTLLVDEQRVTQEATQEAARRRERRRDDPPGTNTPPQGDRDPDDALMAIAEASNPPARRAAIRPQGTARERPLARGFSMALRATVNGLAASVLLDTGSTINAVSPEFTRVARLQPFELSNPISLQLGCVGSRSKANFGVEDDIHIDGVKHRVYMDVVNVPKYDIVLGLPFMHQVQMILDFRRYTITISGRSIPIVRGEGPGQRNETNRNRQRPNRGVADGASVHSVRMAETD